MATIRFKRSPTLSKAPAATDLVDGELSLNYATNSPSLFFKDSNGSVIGSGGCVQVVGQYQEIYAKPSPGMMYYKPFTAPNVNIYSGAQWLSVAPYLRGSTNPLLTSLGVSEPTGSVAGTIGNVYIGSKSSGADPTLTTETKMTCVGSDSIITSSSRIDVSGVAALGYNISLLRTGGNTVAIGQKSFVNDPSAAVFIGNNAGLNSDAAYSCIGVGAAAFTSSSLFKNATNSLAIGAFSFSNLKSNYQNERSIPLESMLAIGANAGKTVQWNTYLTLFGADAGNGIDFISSNLEAPSYSTILGYGAGRTRTVINAVLIGSSASSFNFPGALSPVSIGNNANRYGRLTNAVVIGSDNTPQDASILTEYVFLCDGSGNKRFVCNDSGAWSPDGVDFGTAGQILTSTGPNTPPVWQGLASGTFKISPTQIAVVENGLITQITSD
jgi:hypothetical protein